jgi:mitochondrial intermembrane space import and assembly protein 40
VSPFPRSFQAPLTYHRGMQDCFRLHPELYGSELEDEEDEIEQELLAREKESSGTAEDETSVPVTESMVPVTQNSSQLDEPKTSSRENSNSKQPKQLGTAQADDSTQASSDSQTSSEKDGELIPKAAHDATKK